MFSWIKEKLDDFFRYIRMKYMPKGLLARSIMIILVPLILLQIVTSFIFFDNHWQTVGRRLANIMTGDIAVILSLMDTFPGEENQDWIFTLAEGHMLLKLDLKEGENLKNINKPKPDNIIVSALNTALQENIKKPFTIQSVPWEKFTIINIQLEDGVLEILTPSKRFFSATTYVFIALMVGASLLLFFVAYLFMKNQVRAVNRLAEAADSLGKGHDVKNFKPEGAREVKKAGIAFIRMRDRIKKQITERTNMLSGVSHDLRTPLTRLKLELEMMGEDESIKDIKSDVGDMEKMIEGYLSFARGEGQEKPELTNISQIVESLTNKFLKTNSNIDLHIEEDIKMFVRPSAFERCVNNIISNASKYGENISIKVGIREDKSIIIVDDDGVGIPEEKRGDALKAFVRLDESRNLKTGGVGLGLSIAKDIVNSHGGSIKLEKSPLGGLRVKLLFPL